MNQNTPFSELAPPSLQDNVNQYYFLKTDY